MRAVLLAGGFGTRLRSVVKDVPKTLSPVMDRTFLDYLLDWLAGYDLEEVIFCLHYLSEKIINYVGDGHRWGIKARYSVELEPLGTAGALGLLRSAISDGFCVMNADTYLEVDLKACYQWHMERNALATICTVYMDECGRYGTLRVDKNWQVEGFAEKIAPDQSGWINAGIYIFEPEIFRYIPVEGFSSMERDVLPVLVGDGQTVCAYPYGHNFYDIGVPEDYLGFQHYIASNG